MGQRTRSESLPAVPERAARALALLRREGAARVLELGCDQGTSAIVLALLGAQVVATDVDRRTVERARANAARYRSGRRIQFLCQDPRRPLPFTDATFHVVACNGALEGLSDDQLAAAHRELQRVLRPGGVLLIVETSARRRNPAPWLSTFVPRLLDRLLPRPQALGPHS